ncbi:MAG TPA: hypothetical protein VJ385_10955 [Fibrobacteria bacterium]|nr:hypothetical protein [Fibrobacteria bacterium]
MLTPLLKPACTPACAALTAIARTNAPMLIPTITFENPNVTAFGTTGMSLHEVAANGHTNAIAPPLIVTFGLPIAVDPCAPGKGMGGINSFTQVCHCVNEENAAMVVLQKAIESEVSIPVTSFTKSSAALGKGNKEARAAMAMLAKMVSPARVKPMATWVR